MTIAESKIRLLLSKGKFEEALDYAKKYRKWLINHKKTRNDQSKQIDQEIINIGKLFYEMVQDYHKKFKYHGIDSIDNAVKLESDMFEFYFLCTKKNYISLRHHADYIYEYGKLYDSVGEKSKAFRTFNNAANYYQNAKNTLHNLNQKETIQEISRIQVEIMERQYEISPNQVDKKNMYKIKINAYPNDISPKVDLALIYLEEDKIEQVLKQLPSINYEPKNFDLEYLYFKLDLVYSKFEDAIERANRMLKFPSITDKLVLLIGDLIKLYIRKSDYEEAYNLLNTYYDKFKDNPGFILELVNFYIVTENYTHALFIIEKHYDVIKSSKDLNDILFYIKTKLGLEAEPTTYKQRQISDYSKDKFIKEYERKHERKKRTDSNLIKLECNNSFEILYDEVLEKLESLEPNTRGIFNTYIVDIGKEWGIFNSTKTSIFRVEVLGDKNIVTIEPVSNKYAVSEKRKEKEMS